jgi:hypothetical protein
VWTYHDWFKQIINAVKEQEYIPVISTATKWNNVPEPLRREILEWAELII